MATPKLPKRAISAIRSAVDKLFDRAKARVLGPRRAGLAGSKTIRFGYEPAKSLPGIFANANAEEKNMPDKDTLDRLLDIAEGYVDAQREATKARVVKEVTAFVHEAWEKGIDTDVQTVLGGKLADVWKTTAANMKRIVDTEATTMRNMGVMEGIVKVNESLGVNDPVVFFVVVRDQHLCGECKRLHLMDDGVTPRVWLLSEVGHDYHKRGEQNPKIGGLHPHCRCTMVTLMKGYGFDGSGKVAFIGPDHDEMARQRGLQKAERSILRLRKTASSKSSVFEPLSKMALLDYSTPEFSTWFAGSKVAHPDGKPLPVYHGTSKDTDFSTFKVGDRGAWFTTSPELASQYAKENDSQSHRYEGGQIVPTNTSMRVIPAHLSIKNPYVIGENDLATLNRSPVYARAQAALFRKVRAAGHDGVQFPNGVWVAFHPNQIKSVFNATPTSDRAIHKAELRKSTREGLKTLDLVQPHLDKNAKQLQWADPPDEEPTPELVQAIHKAPIAVHAPLHRLADINASGRFKNLHETHYGMGDNNLQHRKKMERIVLGIPEHVPAEERPLYGALWWHPHHPQEMHTRYEGPAQEYGNAIFVLKPHVKERSTFTPDDSFASNVNENLSPDYLHAIASRYNTTGLLKDHGRRYIEAQIHGGIYLPEDVAELRIVDDTLRGRARSILSSHHVDQAVQMGKQHGFPVYLHRLVRGVDRDLDPSVAGPLRGAKWEIKQLYHPNEKAASLAKSTREGLKTLELVKSHLLNNLSMFHNDMRGMEAGKKPSWFSEGYHELATPELIEALHSAPVAIHAPTYRLAEIDESGRFKNLHETRHGMGDTDILTRRLYEDEKLGIPHEIPAEERPVYGALWWHPHHPQYTNCRYLGPAQDYGNAIFVLKPHVKKRSTLTPDDSFSPENNVNFATDGLGIEATAHRYNEKQLLQRHGLKYVEAQIHGGVYLPDDVAELRLVDVSTVRPSCGSRCGFDEQAVKSEHVAKAVQMGKKYGFPVYIHKLVKPSPDEGAARAYFDDENYDPSHGAKWKIQQVYDPKPPTTPEPTTPKPPKAKRPRATKPKAVTTAPKKAKKTTA